MTGLGVFIVVGYTVLLVAMVALWSPAIPTRRWKLIIGVPALAGVAWLAYAPYAEERDIQARVAELCKDAGVKIVRRVDVEGFYNEVDTFGLGPRSPQAIAEYERGGFRYYEGRSSQPYLTGRHMVGPPEGSIAHIEKQRGEWTATALSKPRARYHFKRLRSDEKVGHKVWIAAEYAILDSQSGETIASEIQYMSLPNRIDLWWTSMLGNPTRVCPDNRGKRLPDDVFIPVKN